MHLGLVWLSGALISTAVCCCNVLELAKYRYFPVGIGYRQDISYNASLEVYCPLSRLCLLINFIIIIFFFFMLNLRLRIAPVALLFLNMSEIPPKANEQNTRTL